MTQLRALLLALLLSFALPTAAALAEPPPAHNDPGLKEAPPLPTIDEATERARRFVQAIRDSDATLAAELFFPRESFRVVKGIKDPDRYFDRLLKVYNEDVLDLRKTLKDPDHIEFVRIELGRQRRWVVVGDEANRCPYWAVYKSSIVVRDQGVEKTLPLRVMITWDDRWYITHLTRK